MNGLLRTVQELPYRKIAVSRCTLAYIGALQLLGCRLNADMPLKSILIVDDKKLVRKTALSALCGLADVCHEAENGLEAVEKVKRLKPDVVLLDISMPLMNGLQAAYEIRRVAPSTKIIFFTVDNSDEARRAAHALGVDAFVTKSDGLVLIQTVKRLLA